MNLMHPIRARVVIESIIIIEFRINIVSFNSLYIRNNFDIVSHKDVQSWLIGGALFTTLWVVGEIARIISSSNIGQELIQEPMCK